MPNVRKSFISALIKKLMTRLTPKYLLILTSYYIQLKHNMLKNKDMVINWSYMNKSIKNPLIKGTIILTAAGLFCRILGFYYRIFLNRHIGAYGMGILQLIMPLCGIAFSVCIIGFNSAISKFTAAYHKSLKPLISGICVSLPVSIAFSTLCYIFADTIAKRIMLNAYCASLIKVIVLGIPLSALHNCICGYYYGCKSTAIPAISQIIEQLVRILGVIIYYYAFIKGSGELTIYDALYGNIFGELSAVLFCVILLYAKKIRYRKDTLSNMFINNMRTLCMYTKRITLYAIPLNLNSLLIHLLESGEAILIPAQLMLYGLCHENAVSTYGIIGGMALPLIMFPSAITNSLAVMLVPKISEDSSANHSDGIINTISCTITLCMHLGIMCSVLFVLYISRLGAIIFGESDVYTYTTLLACVCPFLYLKVGLSSILNGINKTTFTCAANITGLLIRIGFLIVLVPHIGISGYIYGLIISNFIVCLLSYVKLRLSYCFKANVVNNIICPASISIISVATASISEKLITLLIPDILANISYTLLLLMKLVIACIIYVILFIYTTRPQNNSY